MSFGIELSVHDRLALIVRLVGDIDLMAADELSDRLDTALTAHSGGVVIDLSATTYLDSTAIRMLFELARVMASARRRLVLLVTDDAIVRRVVLLTKLDEAVRLASDAQTALAAVSDVAR